MGENSTKNMQTQLENALQSNQKTYDQAILTLSSGAIAILLTFSQTAKCNSLNDKSFLFWSIGFFGAAIACTLFSFLLVEDVVQEKMDRAYRVYIDLDEKSRSQKSCSEKVVSVLNKLGALFFGCGGAIAVIFVCLNIN